MEIQCKTFWELTNGELYQLLRLRAEVFVVEQECAYQDLDNRDQQALHLLGTKNGRLVGYTRIFKPGDYFTNAAIGRVVVSRKQRMFGYGKRIVLASLALLREQCPDTAIEISAQSYLIPFYTELGFVALGGEYLEDGIPHVRMLAKA